MEKTTMINKIKIRLIAICMLFFAITAFIYILFPFIGIAITAISLYSRDWMLALIVSCFTILSYMTGESYMDLFMKYHYAMQAKIAKIRN
jgi:hypothetical protein